MYKTSVTYENYDGEKVTKDLYFNLTKAEITKLQLSYEDGFDKYIDSIIHPLSGKPDPKKIMDLFEMLIIKAYGVRTEDGDFVKSPAKAEAFLSTDAYSELFMRLISDEKAQTEFFIGIMPRDVAAQAQAELDKQKTPEIAEAEVVPMPSSSN